MNPCVFRTFHREGVFINIGFASGHSATALCLGPDVYPPLNHFKSCLRQGFLPPFPNLDTPPSFSRIYSENLCAPHLRHFGTARQQKSSPPPFLSRSPRPRQRRGGGASLSSLSLSPRLLQTKRVWRTVKDSPSARIQLCEFSDVRTSYK